MFKIQKNIFVSILLFSVTLCSAVTPIVIDKAAIARNLKFIGKSTTGLAQPVTNRLVWDSVAKLEFAQNVLASAEPYLSKPFPVWNDSVYKLYYVTGARDQTDALMRSRQVLLPMLVLAECVENKGRFMPVIEKIMVSYCNQPTWTLAAHDWNMDNFKGNFGVDLHAANIAHQFGQTLHLLGSKMNPKVKKLALQNLDKRIFSPVSKSLSNPSGQQWWLTTTNNWNAVCVSGVTSAALATQTDVNVRAFYVTFGQQLITNFLNGFLDDGYCVEGIGYFSYGFGNFMLLRESLMNATNGRVDLFNNPKVSKIANYPLKSEIQNGIFPAIADCGTHSQPADWIMHHLRANYKWDIADYAASPVISRYDFISDLITLFGNKSNLKSISTAETSNSIRSFFPAIGLLYARPQKHKTNSQLAIAIMGGCNGYSHNHNDLGTYNIVSGNDLLMGDMGGPKVYTSKTFSDERYSLYKTFSSVGHPVPLVDGVEQHESLQAKGVVVDTLFTDATDRIVYDLKSGYKTDKLTQLTRSMNYERKDTTVITVTDVFKATSPIAFETALTTREQVKIVDDKIFIYTNNKKLEVKIESSAPYTISQTQIADYGMVAFTRIAISFTNKVNEGEIALRYKTIQL